MRRHLTWGNAIGIPLCILIFGPMLYYGAREALDIAGVKFLTPLGFLVAAAGSAVVAGVWVVIIAVFGDDDGPTISQDSAGG